MEEIRVRFAPSPTGKVHIGNIRAAIYNWLYARHVGGKFLLRVEDTDLERSTPEAIQTLLECMDWLWRLRAKGLEKLDVLERVLHVVVAANDVRDALVYVVHHVGQVENRRPVGTDDREILDVLGLLGHVSLDYVVILDHAILGHAEHDDGAGLAVAGRPLALVGDVL